MNVKPHTPKQPVGQRRNQKGNETISWDLKKNPENTTCQNVWDVANAVLEGKFIMINTYMKKKKRFQINGLNLHLKELEKKKV